MIVQKEFKGSSRGRDNKYDFSKLKAGSCLIIDPNYSQSSDINKFRTNISASLYQWKRYNKKDWKTAVRVEDEKVSVYRIS